MKYKILFCYFAYFSFYQYSIYPAFVKRGYMISDFLPVIPGICSRALQQISSRARTWASPRFFAGKREREREKRLTIREKERTRGTSSNPSNSSDVNARQSVTQGVALLRFVYFSRKALTQAARGGYRLRMTRVHTALHFLVPRSRSSLRRCSLIHSG